MITDPAIIFFVGLFAGYCLAHIAIAIARPNVGTLEIEEHDDKDRYCFIVGKDLEKIKHYSKIQLYVKNVRSNK